jgi:hypothetical protein
VRDVNTWRRCEQLHDHWWCVRHYNPQQLVKGMYGEFLGDWLDNFPRDQLLVMRYEDYIAAGKEHLHALFKFLGG